MKRYIKASIADQVELKLNDWIDQGQDDVDIDDAIFDMGGDESTIDELRQRGRIDEYGNYVYASTLNEYGELEVKIPDDLYDYGVDNAEIIDFLTSFDSISENIYNMFIKNRMLKCDGTLYVEVNPNANTDQLYNDITSTLNHLVDEVMGGR